MNLDPELLAGTLAPMVATLKLRTPLTPSERTEVLRIAQGFACKDSAAAANVSPETIRGRRKRIYRKFEVNGANDLIAVFLALALRMLRREGVATAGAGAAEDATAAGA